MKKLQLLMLAGVCALLLSTACNNSGKESESATKDTVSAGDTIKSDPSQFSDPH